MLFINREIRYLTQTLKRNRDALRMWMVVMNSIIVTYFKFFSFRDAAALNRLSR